MDFGKIKRNLSISRFLYLKILTVFIILGCMYTILSISFIYIYTYIQYLVYIYIKCVEIGYKTV